MRQYLQRIALKIDALSLRERAIIFVMAVLILIMGINVFLLEPQFAKQTQLSNRIKQEQSLIAGLQIEIQQKLTAHTIDPDVENRARLQALKQQSVQMLIALQNMQKSLVSPDKVPKLLEDIVKQNGRVRLMSLKTLPSVNVSELIPIEKKNGGEKDSAFVTAVKETRANNSTAETVYKHGVEIVVQGSYFDILNYLTQLEGMSWQLFWGKAKFQVDEYPKSTLTLILFTLSLDRQWLNL